MTILHPKMSDGKTRCYRKSFTIIELLVVIGVIFILISMLFPALRRAKEATKKIACQNNLKQVGMYYCVYNDDFNNYMPPSYYWMLPIVKSWVAIMMDAGIINDSKVFACPAFESEVPTLAEIKNEGFSGPFNINCVHYGYNHHYIGRDIQLNLPPLKTSTITAPSSVLLTADSRVSYSNSFIMGYYRILPFPDPGGNAYAWYAFLDRRHAGGLNILFCDFHVEGVQCELNPYDTITENKYFKVPFQ